MDVNKLIDAQFRRAVEIVQGLPNQGPIQTGFEEKLAMYSLYKQATAGNVKTPRPGIWDMLGRAKWDAWAKHKDLPQHEAKWHYVETLLKVLRKYSSQTVAMDFVRELEAFQGDPSNLVLSGSYTSSRRAGSESGDSTDSEDGQPYAPQPVPTHLLNDSRLAQEQAVERPVSAVSSAHRYRTPLATSAAAFSPPPPGPMASGVPVPEAQPIPRYAAQSAFSPVPESPLPSGSIPSSAYPTSTGVSASYPGQSSGAPTPTSYGPSGSSYIRGSPGMHASLTHHSQLSHYVSPGPIGPHLPSYYALEAAVQKCQASLAALHERLNVVESGAGSGSGLLRRSGRGEVVTPDDEGKWHWDAQRYGAWTLVLDPLTRAVRALRALDDPARAGPVVLVIRRLMLDASFVVGVLWILRVLWRRSGDRKRQVITLLRWVFYLLAGGERPQRIMVERGTGM